MKCEFRSLFLVAVKSLSKVRAGSLSRRYICFEKGRKTPLWHLILMRRFAQQRFRWWEWLYKSLRDDTALTETRLSNDGVYKESNGPRCFLVWDTFFGKSSNDFTNTQAIPFPLKRMWGDLSYLQEHDPEKQTKTILLWKSQSVEN